MARKKHILAQALIRRFKGQVMPFAQLPQEAQLSMAHYMALDGEAWHPSPQFEDKAYRHPSNRGWFTRHLKADLPHYIAKYGKERFGLVQIPMAKLTEAVWLSSPSDLQKDFAGFDEYHEWYVSNNDTPEHNGSRWPVILASDQDEEAVLQDGWHRFHSYYRDHARIVPALYYPH
jgi:hypothetical protein